MSIRLRSGRCRYWLASPDAPGPVAPGNHCAMPAALQRARCQAQFLGHHGQGGSGHVPGCAGCWPAPGAGCRCPLLALAQQTLGMLLRYPAPWRGRRAARAKASSVASNRARSGRARQTAASQPNNSRCAWVCAIGAQTPPARAGRRCPVSQSPKRARQTHFGASAHWPQKWLCQRYSGHPLHHTQV